MSTGKRRRSDGAGNLVRRDKTRLPGGYAALIDGKRIVVVMPGDNEFSRDQTGYRAFSRRFFETLRK
jgi:hypothetical protein